MSIARIPISPPSVQPRMNEADRPLWSVMIPVYNCGRYLPETLSSVVRELGNRSDAQIEVVDDASTDTDVEALVARYGDGIVGYTRQQRNVGSLNNFHTCLQHSRGHLVHLLHGDDRVRPGFYKAFENLFKDHAQLGAAFCRYNYIDDAGKILYAQQPEQQRAGCLDNSLRLLAERQRIQYASMVVKREVYEHLGGFYGVEYGEDWEMWTRIAVHYAIGYIPEVLADYRKHYESISGRSFLTGKNVRDLTFVMDKIRQLLPYEIRDQVSTRSRIFYADYAMRTANDIWKNLRDKAGVRAQLREAFRLDRNVQMVYKAIKLFAKMSIGL